MHVVLSWQNAYGTEKTRRYKLALEFLKNLEENVFSLIVIDK